MNDTVDQVLNSVDFPLELEAQEKVRNYIGLLASTGNSAIALIVPAHWG